MRPTGSLSQPSVHALQAAAAVHPNHLAHARKTARERLYQRADIPDYTPVYHTAMPTQAQS